MVLFPCRWAHCHILCVCFFFLGYRHVYLEGMEAASIFVHVSVHDITGKVGSKGSDDGISPTRPF